MRRSGENSWFWLAKVVSGVLVIALLLIHLVMNHLVIEGGLMTYADVIRYLSIPGIALMESCFLVIVVVHSLIGLRSILTDLVFGQVYSKILDPLLAAIGGMAIVYGLWLMLTILQNA